MSTPFKDAPFLIDSDDMALLYNLLTTGRVNAKQRRHLLSVLDELCQVRTDGTKTPLEDSCESCDDPVTVAADGDRRLCFECARDTQYCGTEITPPQITWDEDAPQEGRP